MRKLGEHTLGIGSGVMTKYNPIQAAGGFARVAQNLDGYDEPLSFGTTPGSVKATVELPGGCESIHQFEYSDRAGVRHWKQVLLASDGSFHVRDESTAVPLIPGSNEPTFAEPLCSTIFSDRLYLSSKNQFKWTTGGKRYDGTNLRNWGLLAPGQKPILIDHVNAVANWAAFGDSTTLSDSAVSIDGYGSVQIDYSGAGASRQAGITRAITATDFNANDGQIYLYLYIPEGALQKLNSDVDTATFPSFELELTSGAAFTNPNRYIIETPGSFVPGWNFVSFVASDFVAGGTCNLGAVIGVRMFIGFRDDTTEYAQAGFLINYLHQMVNGAPTPGLGAAGNVVGEVSYRTTYLSETGVESNSGSTSYSVLAASHIVDLVSIPVSDDPQVIARRLYRDFQGDSIFRFVMQIDDNATTESTDNVPRASLGGATAPIAGDDELDSSAPPRFIDCVTFDSRVFGIDASDPRIVWVSDVRSPEQFRLVDQLTVDDALSGLVANTSGLMLCGKDRWHIITGDGVNTPFKSEELTKELGTNNFRTVSVAKSFVWTLRESELYLVQDPRDPWYLSANIQDYLDAADLSGAFILHDRSRRRALIFRGTNEILVYQYGITGKGSVDGAGYGVDEQDLRLGAWFTIKLPASVIPLCAVLAEESDEVPKVYIGCSDRFVYSLDDTSGLGWTTASSTEAQEFIWESHALPLGPDGAWSGRGDPRYIEIDWETEAGSTWDCTITSLTAPEGAVVDSVTFPVVFQTGDGSSVLSVPEGLTSGGWARVKLQSRAGSSARLIVRGIRMSYISSSRRWGVRGA